MKKLHTLLTYISSNRVWLITLVCLDLFFVFLAWVAYPGDFLSLVGLMIFVSLAAFVIPFVISIHKRSKIDAAFRRFLLEPDDTNEYLLCESAPASMRPYIHELAAFATGVPPNIYAFHRYTRNSDCPSDTQDLQFQMQFMG